MTLKSIQYAALIFLMILMGCEGDLSPMTVQIHPLKNFDLQSVDNDFVHFDADTPVTGIAQFQSATHRTSLTVAGHRIELRKARFDEASGLIIARPSESHLTTSTGERIGLESSRELICDPKCEARRSFVEERSCQYRIASVPGVYCGWSIYGPQYCFGNAGAPIFFGTQSVEITVTDRFYRVKTLLQGEIQGELARLEGVQREHSMEEHDLTPCQ